MDKILIIGATSAIAQQVARCFANRGCDIFLAARHLEKLAVVESDVLVRGANKCAIGKFDALNFNQHSGLINDAISFLGHIDVVLLAHGILPDQKKCETSIEETLTSFNINSQSFFSLLTELAKHMEKQGHGTIAVISSVASDRGRQSNYVYGAAKSAISTFSDGLRNRLYRSNVHVLTILPGFVDTPMTQKFDKGPLWASPEKVAHDIIRGIEKKKNVIYTPWFWYFIMFIIRSIPEPIFKRMGL